MLLVSDKLLELAHYVVVPEFEHVLAVRTPLRYKGRNGVSSPDRSRSSNTEEEQRAESSRAYDSTYVAAELEHVLAYLVV